MHDVSDGGLAVAIAEMALAGNIGATMRLAGPITTADTAAHVFGEDQGRYLVTWPRPGIDIAALAAAMDVAVTRCSGIGDDW